MWVILVVNVIIEKNVGRTIEKYWHECLGTLIDTQKNCDSYFRLQKGLV